MLDFTLKTLLAYLIGSLLGSLIIGKIRGGVDIRTQGSGNAGGTNALRTQGIWFAIGVMIIDVGKGWFAAAVLPGLPLMSATGSTEWLSVTCAAFAVVGHVYPIWFGFRGGKGAATLIGAVAGLQVVATLITLGVWFCVLILSGYVGLATMIAAASFPVYEALFDNSRPLLYFGVVMAVFVVFTHRSNLARMKAGTEHRSQRFWLLRPR